jgi:hypothetical protein
VNAQFTPPPIESTDDISAAMQAVTAALARGDITPGEAATIAAVVDTFARAIDTTKRRGFAVDPVQIKQWAIMMKLTIMMKPMRIMKLRIAIRKIRERRTGPVKKAMFAGSPVG